LKKVLHPSLHRGLGVPHVMPSRAVKALAKVDPLLAATMRRVGPFRMKRRPEDDVVASLARAIVSQQLSGRVAEVIWGRLEMLLDEVTPQSILSEEREGLRSVGLSYAKVDAVRDLAQKAAEGIVPSSKQLHALSDDEIVERLTEVRGIGRWTVEMLLMFRLGRPDVLPVDDLGIRKGFQKVYRKREMPKPKALLAFGERWRPFRSVASWYLWRSLELD
jgi:DNA-3-methyladenine glycosylase II